MLVPDDDVHAITLRWTRTDHELDTGRWCGIEERQLGPIMAAISTGSSRFACRTGRSPVSTLNSMVQRSPSLRTCLSVIEHSSYADVELEVSSHGEVSSAEVRTWSGDPTILRCIPLLLQLTGRPTDCRWRTQITIAMTIWEP